jgi:hypothetical protein
MRQFGFKKNENGYYRSDWANFSLSNNRSENILSELLSGFFEADVTRSSSARFYQDQAKKRDNGLRCANATCISFTDSNTVLIEPAREVDEKYQYFAELPTAIFISILKQWEKVLINKPDRVVITINDDKSMTFEHIFEEK